MNDCFAAVYVELAGLPFLAGGEHRPSFAVGPHVVLRNARRLGRGARQELVLQCRCIAGGKDVVGISHMRMLHGEEDVLDRHRFRVFPVFSFFLLGPCECSKLVNVPVCE